MSLPDILDFRERGKSLSDLAFSSDASLNLRGRELPERLQGSEVSGNYFALLEVNPVQGRLFLPEDEPGGSDPVVIISERLFRRLFGEDPQLLGDTIILNGVARTGSGSSRIFDSPAAWKLGYRSSLPAGALAGIAFQVFSLNGSPHLNQDLLDGRFICLGVLGLEAARE